MEVYTGTFFSFWWHLGSSSQELEERIVGEVKLTFEEMTTVLNQIEACLNSCPLVPVNTPDDDSIEVLTPGHFLIGQPLTTLPDPAFSHKSIPSFDVGIYVNVWSDIFGSVGH